MIAQQKTTLRCAVAAFATFLATAAPAQTIRLKMRAGVSSRLTVNIPQRLILSATPPEEGIRQMSRFRGGTPWTK